MAKRCPNCGNRVDPDLAFCPECGMSLDADDIREWKRSGRQPAQQAPKQPPSQQGPLEEDSGTIVPRGENMPARGEAPAAKPEEPGNPSQINPYWPKRSKTVAAVLAILLGGLGAHKFYLGKYGQGILYLLFCWTYIPSIIGVIEGISYLLADDVEWQVKHQVRIE